MPVSEFEIIEQVFRSRAKAAQDVIVGIGDDAAVLDIPSAQQLVVSTDTMVSGVHFFADADPFDIGYKSIAVNLSDLAAMGAEPRWMTLSLTLPDSDMDWLQRYADGLFRLADEHRVGLIGGNMANGPLSISITIMGTVAAGQALLRSGARSGDDIYITGMPGMAALGLAMLKGEIHPVSDACVERLLRPRPRVQAGRVIRTCASACIDISDGLAADLGHILEASATGARIELADIPLFDALQRVAPDRMWEYALSRGDDYELCFTAGSEHRQTLATLENEADCRITRIGRIVEEPGLHWISADGMEMQLGREGYRHF